MIYAFLINIWISDGLYEKLHFISYVDLLD